ncbi:MAG: sulfotransferase [Bacteroidales bacterium]|nr:sulfotransferase [Bacteroidales bacterium]
MKKIIFIGGTSRCGSTLLDLILANDPKAFSLGEIHALFHPTRKHHFEEIEKLQKNSIWNKILEEGKRNLYSNLVKYFPHINIFIDSSKDPYWINYHQHKNTNKCIFKNILIHKTPEELAKSFYKRNLGDRWIRAYISYHRKYFALIDSFISIKYKDFVTDDRALKVLCKRLGLMYFADKKKYWESHQETFFGSNSVRRKINETGKGVYRNDITYDNDIGKDLIEKSKLGFNKARIIAVIFWKKIYRIYRYHIPKDIIIQQ